MEEVTNIWESILSRVHPKPKIVTLPDEADLAARIALLTQSQSADQLIIPAGYDIKIIGAKEPHEVKGCCAACGAPCTLYIPSCGYCGTGKPHYALLKKGEKIPEEMSTKLSPGKTTVSQGDFKATIDSEEVDVEKGADVGLVYSNDITLADQTSASALHGIDIKVGDQVRIGEVISMSFAGGKKLIASKIIVTKEGSIELGSGSNIGTLCLDRTVPIPKLKGISVKNIIVGDFNMPKLFPTDLKK